MLDILNHIHLVQHIIDLIIDRHIILNQDLVLVMDIGDNYFIMTFLNSIFPFILNESVKTFENVCGEFGVADVK